MNSEHLIMKAARAVKVADALLIGAGAGMGVDSGLPDFRGDQGFWKAYPVIAKLGFSFMEMANPAWFEKEPHLAWAFYGHRLNLYRRTTPHAGFTQLLALGSSKAAGYFVYTSNVDGQFQKAGFPTERVVECHGSIHHWQCTQDCPGIWAADSMTVNVNEETFRALDPLPHCPKCNAIARPNILMFGDASWLYERSDQQNKRFDSWVRTLEQSKARLVIIELGAGTAVPSVRRRSESMAKMPGSTLIRINPRESQTTHHHLGLPLGAAEGIAQILEELH